ncbi:hypothetical protein MMC26_007356 [Xylographa opegraphella]|nr:hypothetical protein [Xylographa opegraphella]
MPFSLSPPKRKRGVDTLSSYVKNTRYTVYISDRLADLEDNEEDMDLPSAKRIKLHHKTKIITASGNEEFHSSVCQLHAGLDTSLPVRECEDCTRVNKILSLYLEKYQIYLVSIVKEDKALEWTLRKAWDKSRCQFANHRLEEDNTIQVPASPLFRERLSSKRRKRPVRINLSDISEPAVYRSQVEFRRNTKKYKPGKYADTSGSGFLNTSNPEQQRLDGWKSPSLLPLRRVKNPLRSCLKRRRDECSGSFSYIAASPH